MSYYITAHRHGNKINMPIEEKHKYITDTVIPSYDGADITGYSQEINTVVSFTSNNLAVDKSSFNNAIEGTGVGDTIKGSSKSATGRYTGLNLLDGKVKLFYRPEQLTIRQGTGARERIADKVFLKSVNILLNIAATQSWLTDLAPQKRIANADIATFRPTAFTNNGTSGTITTTESDFTLYNQIDWRKNIRQWAKFRIMIVRFNELNDTQQTNEGELKKYIRDWFNTIFVPSIIIPNTTFDQYEQPVYKNINVVSNQSKMLRESTEYNGTYNILYDNVIELAQNDTNKFIQINLEPKMNLTFNSDDHPTSENFNNVFGFIIPPTFYKMDMDTCTYQALETAPSTPLNLATFTTNIKFTYYDI